MARHPGQFGNCDGHRTTGRKGGEEAPASSAHVKKPSPVAIGHRWQNTSDASVDGEIDMPRRSTADTGRARVIDEQFENDRGARSAESAEIRRPST